MKKQLEDLKNSYVNAKTQKEKDLLIKKSIELAEKDANSFGESILELAKETADRAENLKLRGQLEEILPIISVSYISKNYFNKSRQWFYQRLNGNEVNGKSAKFTKDEVNILNEAIQDISKKLGKIQVNLS